MGLSVCLLTDRDGDQLVRSLWRRLEDDGLPSLLAHTHGRHVPHLTLASLLDGNAAAVCRAVSGVSWPATTLSFEALGVFPRSRCWLVPTVSASLLAGQQTVAAAVQTAGATLHRSYHPGGWQPHLTLAPRLHLADLPTVARHCFDALPLTLTFDRGAVIDTATGDVTEVG